MISPTRRTVLAGAAASLVFGGSDRVFAQSAPHTFKLGTFEITVISDGGMSLPLSFILPKTDPQEAKGLLAKRGLGGDAYAAHVNVTVVKTGDALIVIDSGGTTDFMPTLGQFSDRLERAGVKVADVTHVILTHAHPDHFWGLIDPLDDDSRFTAARHILTTAERDHWLKPGVEDGVPESMKGITIGTTRRMKAVASRIDAVTADSEILSGVTLVSTAGHTPGHASVLLKSGGQSLLVGGDALSHPVVSFERPEWVWGADYDSQVAVSTRKRLLDFLATDRIAILGYHLPWPGIGRVERDGAAYRFVQG
jgi:glyoxylase-like metal-dependent hydrolase (beta-lactamase superfamily II)